MTDLTGKYIIFCANYEAMQDAIGKAGEWFGQIDSAPHIYSVYSLDGSPKIKQKGLKLSE